MPLFYIDREQLMRYPNLTVFFKHGIMPGLSVLLLAFMMHGALLLFSHHDSAQNTSESFCEISSIDHLNVFELEIPGTGSLSQELPDKNKKKPCSLFKQYNTFWISASKSAGCEIHNFDNSHINRIPNCEHLWQLRVITSHPSPVRAGPTA